MTYLQKALIASLLAFMSLLSPPILAEKADKPAAQSPQEVIAQKNRLDLTIYGQLKEKMTKDTDPLIIAWSTKLSFYHHHKLQEYPIVNDEYTDLKSIAHVALATFALFHPDSQFPKNIALVKTYKDEVLKTLQVVDDLPLTSEQKITQKAILNKTADFLQQAIAKNAVSQEQLKAYVADVLPDMSKNKWDSAKSLLGLLNQQMVKIQQQLTPEEKNRLFVVIPGFKMPRKDNIIEQYFAKLLNEPIDSKRFIYAEGLLDTDSVLALVGTWKIDAGISRLYFHDPEAMKRDLLASDASDYLKHCHADSMGKRGLICSPE